MIGCICKYSPFAIFDAFDETGFIIEETPESTGNSDVMLHTTVCSYSKVCLDNIIEKKIDKVVLVNCCDSIKRLYDTLKNVESVKFLYMIDLPRKNSCCSKMLYKDELLKFIKAYERFSGKKFDLDKFNEALYKYVDKSEPKQNYVAVLGAKVSEEFLNAAKDEFAHPIVNYTCSKKHYLTYVKKCGDLESAIEYYADEILSYMPCMRMIDISERKKLLNDPNLKGIIYHTLKFCDHYSFEYASIQKNDIPILKLETDFTDNSSGQFRTRMQAFNELLSGGGNEEMKSFDNTKKYVAGIDSGSTSTNVIILDRDKNVLASTIVKTGAKSKDSANIAIQTAIEEANIKMEDLAGVIATGYGRYNIEFATDNVTEITCHAKGAHFLNPSVRTIIDIGGQDSKAISLDENANVKKFVMNDKCAAGTGRFLEMIAKTLDIDLAQMANEGLKYKEDINITSVCSVFAESEVISLIAENKEKSDIIHGVNKSIAAKTVTLVDRVSRNEGYMMTGGVAKNKGVVKELEKKLDTKIFIAQEPQICGAMGAALIALERFNN